MMFPNSLKYIAPLFPSRILSPLLPSFKLPSFNFLSLRYIDSYGFTLNQKNYHEIPYNHEHKLNVLKNVPKISFDHDSKENQNQNENKNNVSSDAKNKKQNENENCNGEPMLKKNRNNEFSNLIDKHYLDNDNFYYHRNYN